MLVAAACAGVVAGAMLQAATGFGFSLVAAPLLFAAIGPEPAVVLLLVLGLEVNLLTLGTERRRPRPLHPSTAIMLAWAIPGSLAGVAPARALAAGAAGGGHARRRRARSRRGARAGRHLRVPRWGGRARRPARSPPPPRPPARRCCCICLGRGATPEQVRDTLTVCFLGLSAHRAPLALFGHGHPGAAATACSSPRWSPQSPSPTWSGGAPSPA